MEKTEFYMLRQSEFTSEFGKEKDNIGKFYSKGVIITCRWVSVNFNTKKKIKLQIMKCLIYFIFSTIILFMGCKKADWYDVKSNKKLAVPSTLKDMQALLDNASVMNSFSACLGEISSDGHYLTTINSTSLNSAWQRNAYTWTKELPNITVSDWVNGSANGSYVRVYYANLILDGLAKIETNEQNQWNDIKGQALFQRSRTFYELSQIFAEPYDVSNANGKLGIPLRLESDINIPSNRSTLKQTYDQTIDDLLQAKDLLPLNSPYKTRASKLAVYALLARIYLSIGNYEQAFNYSNICLENYSALLTYSTLNSNSTSNPFNGYISEVIFYAGMNASGAMSLDNILIDPELFNSYNSQDLRKKIFFNLVPVSNLVRYKGTYCGNGFPTGFSGLATDEVYLIRAECYARQGKILEAMKDLNTLLKSRWSGTYIDMMALDSDDALRKVLEERKKELILRGLRWSDLRRLNKDPRFAVTLTRTIGGKTYTLEPNSYKYTFPIPDDIIQMTGMEQNEGWK